MAITRQNPTLTMKFYLLPSLAPVQIRFPTPMVLSAFMAGMLVNGSFAGCRSARAF
jgi:hypothetical protein